MFVRHTKCCDLKLHTRRLNHFKARYLDKCEANFAALTPLSLFQRTIRQYPTRQAYVYGNIDRSWREVGERSSMYADGLRKLGITKGDVVSIISPNTPAMYESHFAVPGAEAVLHTINTRLDATTIAFQLGHCGAKIVLVDTEFNNLMLDVRALMLEKKLPIPKFINIIDTEFAESRNNSKPLIGDIEYEDFLLSGDPSFPLIKCADELDAMTLNYTSGTTGSPKGVVAHYRGAYLNSLANQLEWNMEKHARFLWVVPMFHCNGWCFPWTMAACAGTSYFTRQVRAEAMFHLIHKYKIQYMSAAPVVLNTLLTHPKRQRVDHSLKMWVAGSPPAPSVIRQFTEELNIQVQTAYGLTESYGPISTYVSDIEWTHTLSDEDRLNRTVTQCTDATVEDLRILDPETMVEVPPDGVTLGEVMMKGNIIMKGYLGNEAATLETFKGGWFHTGDLAVSHGNGRFELKDRSKDIIISGGENISSTEVENIMMTHPAVLEVAVVAMPDSKWQEVPCAFVTLKPDYAPVGGGGGTEAAIEPLKTPPTEQELLLWCRSKMAHFQAPKKVVYYAELPKTTTGKVQKNLLRNLVKSW